MSRALTIGLLSIPLASCVAVQDAADQIAREQARGVVNAEVERRFPGVDATPITDCVIDNASAQEIVTIGGSVALGQAERSSDLVGEILQRPATLECTASTVFNNLIGG